MKHFSKLLFLLLAPVAAIAQPTITVADLPTIGSLWVAYGDTSTVLQITPGGPNQTWNYAAQLANPTDTTYSSFISPSATPPAYQQAFPNATMASYEPADSAAVFFKTNSTGLYLDGVYIDANIGLGFNSLDYNPDQLYIPVPFTYNNTRNHTSKYTISAQQMGTTFKIVQYIYQTFTADAFGSLTTPNGTYPNTLRIKHSYYLVDTVYADLGGILVPVQSNGPHDTTNTYMWGQNGANSLLMQIQEDMNNLGNSTPGGGAYYGLALLGAPAAVSAPQVSPYPNPATTQIRFPIEAEGAESLIIYDMLGKPVSTERVRGINTLTYGTSQLAAGVYSYSLLGKDGAELQKGKFSVVR